MSSPSSQQTPGSPDIQLRLAGSAPTMKDSTSERYHPALNQNEIFEPVHSPHPGPGGATHHQHPLGKCRNHYEVMVQYRAYRIATVAAKLRSNQDLLQCTLEQVVGDVASVRKLVSENDRKMKEVMRNLHELHRLVISPPVCDRNYSQVLISS